VGRRTGQRAASLGIPWLRPIPLAPVAEQQPGRVALHFRQDAIRPRYEPLQIGDELAHLSQGALGEISDARPIFLKDQLQLPACLVEVLG
jgi:hypothetical protein